MTKLLIFDAFTLLIREKNVANYALLRCKTFSLKIWLCKIFDKFHVCKQTNKYLKHWFMSLGLKWSLSNIILQPKSQRGGRGLEQIVLIYKPQQEATRGHIWAASGLAERHNWQRKMGTQPQDPACWVQFGSTDHNKRSAVSFQPKINNMVREALL